MRSEPSVFTVALDQFHAMKAPTVIVSVVADGDEGVFYATYSLEAVSLPGIRCWSRRFRRQVAGLLLVVAVAGMVAFHHSGTGVAHVEHDGMTAVVELCVGAFTAVGTAIAAVTLGVLALGRWPTQLGRFPGGGLAVATSRAPGARAGPRLLSELCVWRC